MRNYLAITIVLCCPLAVICQHLDVEGKMLVKDINTIATFQSTAKNSFISFATNDDPMRSTNVGYFDDNPDNNDGILPYFFIDTPEPGFGEFIMLANGNVGIGTPNPSSKLSVITSGAFADHTIDVISTGRSSAGLFSKATGFQGVGVWGISTDAEGAGLYGLAASISSMGKGVVAHGGLCDFDAIGPGGDYCSTSSKRWKTNISNISDPLDKLSKLRGVTFNWDAEHGGHLDIGFIAEEVGKVLPEIVQYESNGIDASSMDYSRTTALLVEAANAIREEYQAKFIVQESRIALLEQKLAEIKTILEHGISGTGEE